MKKHLFFFFAAFAIGCVAALAARSALFQPYDDHAGPPAAPEHSQMVTNPTAPATDPHAGHGETAKPAPAADPHAGHRTTATDATANTICAICGMEVDPSIKPALYEGKLVGFGCHMCPQKFTADPDRYGPAALENKTSSH